MNAPQQDLAELVALDPKNALEIFTTKGADPTRHEGLDPILALVRARIDAFEGDVSTEAGRKQIASMAYAVARSKGALETVGERLAKEAKELPKKIDAGRKYAKDTLDAWRDEVRKPLTDFEEAEEKRIAGHAADLEALKAILVSPPSTAAELRDLIATTEGVSDGKDREEFADGFKLAKASVLKSLREKLEWRCYSETNKDFRLYGGRGITVCDRWHTFEAFVADMGEKPEGFTIERSDNDGNYEPGNCFWATRAVQGANTRRVNRVVVEGQEMSVRAACDRMGLSYSAVRMRICRGSTPAEALR